jgi:serine/threonine protein kinase
MTADLRTRVRELFGRAAALDHAARGQLLESALGVDPEAAAEVSSLLEHHDRTGVILDRTPLALAALLSPPPGPAAEDGLVLPATIGNYTLERVLGSGGMGVVYQARQASPNRAVAVKLIRPEMLSPAVRRRFEHEAEVLGLLDHPGIARVFEAGAAPLNGQPRAFMAMELIEGEPLTAYADRRTLSNAERVALLAQVCDAVQFAHRRGVIHRDLKPANILVPADGRARVVDFGVARLLARDQASTLTTGAGQIVGTLAYMSPEQAGGDAPAIDSRSDIYSLGAVLFELLCGRPPIDISTLSVHGALAAIQSVQPRVADAGRAALGRDLEAVRLKSHEKDPARR